VHNTTVRDTRTPRPLAAASSAARYVPVFVVVLGTLVVSLQALIAFGHFLALWVVDSELEAEFPGDEPLSIDFSDYVRAAKYASLNIALCAICVVAIIAAVRSSRRKPTAVSWLCLAIIGTVAVMSFTRLSFISGGSV
jgi:hypothetical protein